jgi:hypothetical protein
MDPTIFAPFLDSSDRLSETPIKCALRFLLLAIALLCPVERTHSQSAVQFSQPTLGGGSSGQDQVQGWEFVPRVNVTVLDLGLYDGNYAGGFQQSHTVAIWDGNGDLISSAFIPQGETAPLQDNFRYVSVSLTPLYAGETYIIGAFMPAPVSDYTVLYDQNAIADGTVTFDPRIEFVAYREGLSPGSINFPQSRWTDYIGAFGPNFIIAAPEPSTFALLSVALATGLLRAVRVRRSTLSPNRY